PSHARASEWRRGFGRSATVLFLLGAAVTMTGVARAADNAAIQYNRDIRPILAENCFACHGPDSASRKADLRLDQRDAAVKAGAVAPGDLEQSGLVHRIGPPARAELEPRP